MTRTLVLLALVAAGGCSKPQSAGLPAPAGPAAKPARLKDQAEYDALQGVWRVEALTAGGKPVPAERLAELRLEYVFDPAAAEPTVTTRRPDRPPQVQQFAVDPSASPKRMMLVNKAERLKTLAVYQVDGDTLTLCLTTDEKRPGEYPAGLRSTADPKTDLITLRRQPGGPAAKGGGT